MPGARYGFLLIAFLMTSALSRPTPLVSDLPVQTFASLKHPVNLTWTGNDFIGSYRDGVTRLVRIGTNGTVHPFAPSFLGQEEVYVATSPGRAGFPQGYLFLSSGDSVYSMDPSGSTVYIFATPAPSSRIEYLTFDGDGVWGYLLYALITNGDLFAISATGTGTRVANLGANLVPEGIAFASPSFGAYAGDMLVSIENAHEVVAIPLANTSRIVTLAHFPNEAPERVLVIPRDTDLFVAEYDRGIILRLPALDFSDYVGLPLVITEGENGQVGSMSVLETAGSNVSTIRILSDSSSPHFEGAAFVPTYAAATSVTTTQSTGLPAGEATAAAVSIVAVAILGLAIILKRRRVKPGPLAAV